MISLPYSDLDTAVITPISGGRKHFTYRHPVRASESYLYEILEGDTMHSLAQKVFGDDTLWWVLADLNKPKDPFMYEVGDSINLPEILVAYNKGKNRIS